MHAPLALAHGDLGAVACLARERRDLDDAARDLGHLEGEEATHERGVRAAHGDRGALESARDARDVDADALAVRVVLTGHLLLRGQDRLDRPEVDVDHARVRPLLDDAGDDVALATLELAEHLVVADVAQALVDDLLGRERGDAPEVVGAVGSLADHGALVVEHGRVDRHMAGLAVELDAGLRRVGAALIGLIGVLEVGREDRLLDDLHELVERDLPLALHHPQDCQVDVHVGCLRYSIGRRATRERGRGSDLHGTRLRAPSSPPAGAERNA
jgi:hypothetical protein